MRAFILLLFLAACGGPPYPGPDDQPAARGDPAWLGLVGIGAQLMTQPPAAPARTTTCTAMGNTVSCLGR